MCFPAVRLVLRIGAVQHRMRSRVFVGSLALDTVWIIDIHSHRAYVLASTLVSVRPSLGSKAEVRYIVTSL